MNNKKKSQKPKEQDAFYTTIVGGRPPGSGTKVGNIPRGIEVLVKKASVDPEFRNLLLEKRAETACDIDLELEQTEVNMLAAIPQEQLEKIIENTIVPSEQKPVFMSRFGKIMLTVLITGTVVLIPNASCAGISPDRIHEIQLNSNVAQDDQNDPNKPQLGTSDSEQSNEPNHMLPYISRGISPVRTYMDEGD